MDQEYKDLCEFLMRQSNLLKLAAQLKGISIIPDVYFSQVRGLCLDLITTGQDLLQTIDKNYERLKNNQDHIGLN